MYEKREFYASKEKRTERERERERESTQRVCLELYDYTWHSTTCIYIYAMAAGHLVKPFAVAHKYARCTLLVFQTG